MQPNIVTYTAPPKHSHLLLLLKQKLVIFGLIGFLVVASLGVSGFLYYKHKQAKGPNKLDDSNFSLSNGASLENDSSASDGKSIKITKNAEISTILDATQEMQGINFNARSVICGNEWAKVDTLVDDKVVQKDLSIDSDQWKNFSVNTPITKGNHKIVIKQTNASGACERAVFIDKVNLISIIPAVQSPTPTKNNQPTTTVPPSSTTPTQAPANPNPTPNPQPPAKSSILWGSWIDGDTYGGSGAGRGDAPWDTTTWDLFESHAGKKVSILHYGQPPPWEQQFYPNVANIITNRGAYVMMDSSSKSVALTDITNGTYDTQIRTWANAVKTWGKPMFYRWNWEMNGTWFDWGNQAKTSPQNYVNAWRHYHDVVVSEGATNITWVWCPNTVFTGSTPLSQLYPGDSYVDWTCFDGYNWGTSSGKAETWRSFNTVASDTYNELLSVAPSKPIMIGETSSNEGGGVKADWVTDALSTQLPNNFPKIKALVWFNWPIVENSTAQQWPIESSTASQNAFKNAIANSYFLPGGSYGSTPLLGKIPAP